MFSKEILMTEAEIACANFTKAFEKYKLVMGSRSKSDIERDTYKAKTKGVLNGKIQRTFGTTV